MGSHGSVLVKVVNAKVADCRATEAQCHAQFAQYRTNGEWFSADLEAIIRYTHMELDWMEIDYVNQARLGQSMLFCRASELAVAKAVLTDGRGRAQCRKPCDPNRRD
ncbi:conserved hypothetical protein [Paraburkholderia piptadeniae]|uniref:Uncharacterized protein n=1 Tax=Paraburkholderia piptadeniae TaxID=1701573 RepID=A0A1N7RUJ0_9BURK|nr:conserved hypothetical protein [Paraburkholderia piptadeniae]